MKILLAPSETKQAGGKDSFDINKLSFDKLSLTRKELLSAYQHIIDTKNMLLIKKMFGFKKDTDIQNYLVDILSQPTLKAIQRYTGVAYDYINYQSLDKNAQTYIDKNVLIFSNLFGILKADDFIPTYRLKQGEPINTIYTDKAYKESLKPILDEYLQDKDILDLRANYYQKFYKISHPYTTLKFLKNGKVVSHWAKAYRGIVLKTIAQNNTQTIQDFLKLQIENLSIKEIIERKAYTEVIYEIS